MEDRQSWVEHTKKCIELAYLKNRMEMQKGQLSEIERTFGDQVLAHVPELERDVTGLPMIERVAGILFADEAETSEQTSGTGVGAARPSGAAR